MSLMKCPDCGHEISDQAPLCINCGRPSNQQAGLSGNPASVWNAVTRARTPINIFALTMAICGSVLGVSATQIENCYAGAAFTYTIHAFLAVSGMFFLAILFCRKGVYHPQDLEKIGSDVLGELGKDRPVAAASLIIVMLFAYGLYQYTIDKPCGVEPPPPGSTMSLSRPLRQDVAMHE